MAVDLPALVVSGQRAAALVYLPSLLVVLLRRGDALSLLTLLGAAVLCLVGAAAGLFPSSDLSFGGVAAERVASGLGEIPARLDGNLIRPSIEVLERWPVLGEGPGMFSSGLRNLADLANSGQYVFRVTRTAGSGRPPARLIGMIIDGSMLWTLATAGVHLSKRAFNYLTLLCAALALWSNTHDLFNNYVMMWQGFLLGGIVLLNEEPILPGRFRVSLASS